MPPYVSNPTDSIKREIFYVIKGNLSSGAIAGIAVGAIVFIVILAVIVYFYLKKT